MSNVPERTRCRVRMTSSSCADGQRTHNSPLYVTGPVLADTMAACEVRRHRCGRRLRRRCSVLRRGTAGPAAVPQQFRSGIDLVRLPVVVTGKDGLLVRGLAATDFQIVEDGVPQTVVAFAEGAPGDALPLHLGLLLDGSESMEFDLHRGRQRGGPVRDRAGRGRGRDVRRLRSIGAHVAASRATAIRACSSASATGRPPASRRCTTRSARYLETVPARGGQHRAARLYRRRRQRQPPDLSAAGRRAAVQPRDALRARLSRQPGDVGPDGPAVATHDAGARDRRRRLLPLVGARAAGQSTRASWTRWDRATPSATSPPTRRRTGGSARCRCA